MEKFISFDEADLFADLMTKSIIQQAQINSLHAMLKILVHEIHPDMDMKEYSKKINDVINQDAQSMFSEHRWFSEYWKNHLKENLGDIPGISL